LDGLALRKYSTDMETATLKKCAILGTAASWKQCPWGDKDLEIFGLNDAHVLGYPRVDAWWDLHPLSAFVFYDRNHPPDPRTIPAGTYLRPQGHLEWLKKQKMPVYLQQARPDWPSSRTFPKDEVLAFWSKFWPWRVDRHGKASAGKDYEVSSPSWMLMWAVAQGYTEIHIYGIHLSTEWEYLQQRPNLEFLIGVAAGLGIKIVLPDIVPICQAKFTYGYETKADASLQPVQLQIDSLKRQAQKTHAAIMKLPWWARAEKADLQTRLAHLDIELKDAHDDLARERVRVN